MTSTNLTPVAQIGKTILGTIRELQAYSGVAPTYDTAATLNAKYGIGQALVPTALPTVSYFGIGIGGNFNLNNANLQQPYPVLKTNMDLYAPIPFRCVPVEQDLSAQDRAAYRMRVRQTINGADYFCYFLKAITYNTTTVQITETDPNTQIQSPYTLDYANLRPTPPAMNSNGTPTSSAAEINVSITSNLPLTGAEVTEVINVLYGGDLRYAKISEIGLYSGQDRQIQGLDVNAASFNYTEAVLAQLNAQYNWNGDDFSSPNRATTYQIAHGSGDLLML